MTFRFSRHRVVPLDTAHVDLVARVVPGWASLAPAQRQRLCDDTATLLGRLRFEPARGVELTEAMCVVVAGLACLLVLGLDLSWYADVTSVIVHQGVIVDRSVRAGPVPGVVSAEPQFLSGQTFHRGPVVIDFEALMADLGRHHGDRNVVIHEFAHRLDLADGVADGTPPLGDADRMARWVAVCRAEYDRLVAGAPDEVLRPYAATDPAEFFAVASEVFFCRPALLSSVKPTLYAVLADFYRQDPARR